MLRLPSNQKAYDEFWSGDPAFIQAPVLEPIDKLEPEERKAQVLAFEEYARLVRVARETGDWKPLRVGDAEPTRFVFKPLTGDQFRKIGDLMLGGKVGKLELAQLMVRVALQDIVKLDDVKVERRGPHENPNFRELGPVVSVAVTDHLDAIDTHIVGELGALVLNRARGPDPK